MPPREELRGMKAYKVVFLGDQMVGKTALIARFLYGAFENLYSATIGIDFVSKVVALSDRSIKNQFWDAAGQERFRSLIPLYLRDTSGCVVVYDVTNRKSFESVEGWVAMVRRERPNVVIALVGTKADMDTREVSEQEGEELAWKLDLHFFTEASAKSGANVTKIFTEVGEAIVQPSAAEAAARKEARSLARACELVTRKSEDPHLAAVMAALGGERAFCGQLQDLLCRQHLLAPTAAERARERCKASFGTPAPPAPAPRPAPKLAAPPPRGHSWKRLFDRQYKVESLDFGTPHRRDRERQDGRVVGGRLKVIKPPAAGFAARPHRGASWKRLFDRQ